MTAEQAFQPITSLINQVQDAGERLKLENLILGAVESKEKQKARIRAQLDKNPRYQIKPKKNNKLKS